MLRSTIRYWTSWYPELDLARRFVCRPKRGASWFQRVKRRLHLYRAVLFFAALSSAPRLTSLCLSSHLSPMTASEIKPVAGPAGFIRSTTIYGCKDSVNALSISGDGKYLVSGGDEGLLRVFSLAADYKEICRFQNQSPVLSVAWLNRYSFTFLMGDWSGDVFTIRVKLPNTPVRIGI